MSTGPEEKPTYEFGPFRLDPAERLLLRDGQAVPLTPKAFDLLVCLVERHGRLVEKSTLMRALWPDTVVEEANVAYNISALRKVLGDDREDARFIETVPTRGYRFVARVAVSSTRPSDSIAIPSPVVPGRSRGNFSAYRIGLGLAAAAMLIMVLLFFAQRDVTRTPAAIRENSLTRLTGNPADRPLESARISPDGKRLAYADAAGVHIRRVDGGDMHSIPDTRGMDVFGWTSDSENVRAGICSEARCTVWDVPTNGSPRTPTGATWADNERGDISANGSELLTVTEAGEIAVRRLNGSTPRRVVAADGFASVRAAALSIDGSRVFFTNSSGTRIESVSADGGATSLLHTLPKGWAVLSVGPVLADGRLLFVAAQTTLPYRFASSSAQAIWQINTGESAGKSDAERVTEWRYELIEQVSASADGKRIAFLSTEQQWDVYTASFDPMTARLDTPTQLTRDDRHDMASAWMPDNATVLFFSSRNGSLDVFRQRFDSDIASPVVDGPGNQVFPRVTSDGRWILFGDDSATDHPKVIARLPLTGGVPERVMPPISGIVHCAVRGGCVIAERRGNELVVSSLDPLRGRGTELFRQHGDVPGASLSADGSKWAYIMPPEEPGTPQRIRIVPFDDNGSVSEIVVQNTERLVSLDWSPSGGGFFSNEVTYGGSFFLSNGQLAQRSKLLFIVMDGQTSTLWAPESLLVGATIPSRDGRRLAINVGSRRSNAWMVSVS
jgi:DNA-binding winged helix-turn-helix (wHTH) protein/Tol biopolymer transport system component